MRTLVVALVCALVVCCTATPTTAGKRKRYDGYKLFEIIPETEAQVQLLRKWMMNDDYLDFWREPHGVGKQVDLFVSPKHIGMIEVRLRKAGIPFTLSEQDLQIQLNELWKSIDSRPKNMPVDLDNFNAWEDIMPWMDELVAACPAGVTCQTYSLGNSEGARQLKVLKVSKTGVNRRAYWLDATIHAREWLTTATILKIMNHVVNNYATDAIAREMVDTYDWYFLPVMNPDGYTWTWSNDRMWRKNRARNIGSTCLGTDLNRNFDFRWGTDGVSHTPCSDIYCGDGGGSELETRAVSAEAGRIGSTVSGWLTMHAYGQMWMFPWGNLVNHVGSAPNDCELAADHFAMMSVANAAANAVENTYNTNWERGNSCVVIYETSGGTDDYVKGAHGVVYPVCPELRGSGFVIAASQIEPSFREFWSGVVAMTRAIALQ